MNARKMTALTLVTLMMSGVACSKRNNNHSASPASQEDVSKVEETAGEKEEKKPDCSNLKGSWELDEELKKATEISQLRFDKNEEGVLSFILVGQNEDHAYLLNGEEQVEEVGGKEVRTKGTCTHNGMLVVERQVKGEVKGRWVFVQAANSPTVQLALQELTSVMDGPKGEETLQVKSKDIVTGQISRLDEMEVAQK